MINGRITVETTVKAGGYTIEMPEEVFNFNFDSFDIETELEDFERGFLASVHPNEHAQFSAHVVVNVLAGSAAYTFGYEYESRTHELKRVEG